MRAFTDARSKDTEDEIWIVEHPPVFTQGVAGKPEHLLFNPSNIPVVKTDRGGQITYHGPGQVMLYVLLDLKRAGFGVRELVVRIENAVIATLAGYGIAAYGKRDAPGVYVSVAGAAPHLADHPGLPSPPTPLPEGEGSSTAPRMTFKEGKIASLGLKIRNGCTYHGVAFNVDMDLTPFSCINPCGFEGLRVTHLHELGVQAPLDAAGMALALQLERQLSAR